MPPDHQLENVRYEDGGPRNLSFRQGVKALVEGSGALRLAVSHDPVSGDGGYSLRVSRSSVIRSDSAKSPTESRGLQTSSLDLRSESVLCA